MTHEKQVNYLKGDLCNRLVVLRDLTKEIPDGLFEEMDTFPNSFFHTPVKVAAKNFTVKIEIIVEE